MSCLSVKFFFWLSDLCEQRGRAQRLHQSGERKEEGLRALRCPGDHLRQTFRKMKTETERVRERERDQDEPPGGVHPIRNWSSNS